MTAANKNYDITRSMLDGQEVRGTVLNKRKYYFLADLKRLYGSRFIPYLPANPISLRISVSGNSQMRQLVNVSEFKDGYRKYKQAAQPAKNTTTAKRVVKLIAPQLEFPFEAPEAPKEVKSSSGPTNTRIAPVVTKEEDEDVLQFRWKTIRMNINKLIADYSEKQLQLENVPARNKEAALKARIIKNYWQAYEEFDKSLAADAGVDIEKLASHGLGMVHRGKGKKYLDILQSKRLLQYLETVVERLFKLKA